MGDPQYPQLQDWAIHLVRDMPQKVELVKYTNSDKAKVHVLGEMVLKDARFGDYTSEQQRMIVANGICPEEPARIFEHCRAVYLVKMTNFEIDPHELGDSVQQGIDFVHQQHAQRTAAPPAA